MLTGGLAVGKTAVAQQVVAEAAAHGLRVAAVDLDWLGWISDAHLSVDELISRNLAAVAANYAAAGIDRLVLARALVSPASRLALGQALIGWSFVIVRLDASRPTLERRVRARDTGEELARHLADIDEMARLTSAATPDAPVVSNDGRPIRDVAMDVMRIAGWIRE